MHWRSASEHPTTRAHGAISKVCDPLAFDGKASLAICFLAPYCGKDGISSKYLLGVSANSFRPWASAGAALGNSNLSKAAAVKELCIQLRDTGVRSPYLLAMLADIYEDEARAGEPDSLKAAVCQAQRRAKQ